MAISTRAEQIRIMQDLIKTYQQYHSDPAVIQEAMARLDYLQRKEQNKNETEHT